LATTLACARTPAPPGIPIPRRPSSENPARNFRQRTMLLYFSSRYFNMFDNFKFFSRYTKKLFLAAGNRQTDKRPKIIREISAKLARKTPFPDLFNVTNQ
jgi:hypothetical protein